MFTGIIQKLGTVVSVETSAEMGRVRLRIPPWERPYEHGESIAVNGVCLTVAGVEQDVLTFDVLQQTFKKTNLGGLAEGCQVNLERALRYGDALGGHLVSGHVDGVGRVSSLTTIGRDVRIQFEAPPSILADVVSKGSIACDGISLTVAERFDDGFAVHLIPTTLEETYWSDLAVGDPINLEADMVCKLVRQSAERGELAGDWSWETFQTYVET